MTVLPKPQQKVIYANLPLADEIRLMVDKDTTKEYVEEWLGYGKLVTLKAIPNLEFQANLKQAVSLVQQGYYGAQPLLCMPLDELGAAYASGENREG